MKIYRFRYRKRILRGILKEEFLFPLKGSIFRDFKIGDSPIPMGEVKLLPPVEPSKIVAVGRNYQDHAKELGNPVPEEPLLFLKPSTAVIGPNDEIHYPAMSSRVDYEGELAVVIKKKACHLREEDPVEDYILGYTCFNDITARDLQAKDVQFTRAKSFDTFAAVGPCIATGIDPGALHLKTFLNGKLVQSGTTANLIFPVPFLVRFISRVMTLLPGDIIATGTPSGIGPMNPGDRVDVQVEGIGVLSNTLVRAKQEKEDA
ncbi:MAG: fumarylacetoacetate hydrolase family protein [Candidatus Aminicenantales bacterium]|jgi:2-keto-4-pentenoate hydratase/2-oxohepta-3-ene-1,7-dioic acid hydratase in catechol pathway